MRAVALLLVAWCLFATGEPRRASTVQRWRAVRDVPSELADVDVFIGTNGHGYGFASLYPGPQVPFGSTRVSPDTSLPLELVVPWTHNGGYWYPDNHIRFFSHVRLVGAGVRDMGNIGVMPRMTAPVDRQAKARDFAMPFSHASENAWPGYYSVVLGEKTDRQAAPPFEDVSLFRDSIRAELSASAYTAVHRYTYGVDEARAKDGYIVFDLFHALSGVPTSVKSANITINDGSDGGAQEVSGWLYNNGDFTSRVGGINLYFAASFNETFRSYGSWGDDAVVNANQTSAAGNSSYCGAYVGFEASGGQPVSVEMSLTVSWISLDQARQNAKLLESSGSPATFDDVATSCENEWVDALGKIKISGGSADNRTVFYTALYHAYLAPTQYAEAGGAYLGFDWEVHTKADDSVGYYSDMSIWDTHRTEFPWLRFAQPQVLQDIARSLVLMFQQGGDLPRWPLANGYTNSMIGTHADVVLSDAATAGLNFDYVTAYAGMYQGATEPQQNAGRTDIPDYTTIGYVPYDVDEKGCPKTQAYALDDWAVSNLAAILNHTSDFEMFRNRSANWKTQFHPSTFMCPKTKAGEWECPPIWTNVFDKRYVEGDAWHYRFNAPHDGFALVQMYNSSEYFVEQLDYFFNASLDYRFNNFLPNPYYWAGNEEDLHAAYMFHWAHAPSYSQKWVRTVLETKYSTDPLGIPGNDDYGTLSAWALWGYIGLYPMAGNNTYLLGSPVFDSVSVTIEHPQNVGPMLRISDEGIVTATKRTSNSTVVQITAKNQSPSNVYVQSATMNGKELNTPFITLEELIGSSSTTIEVTLGDVPSSWGT